jgi:hypothetical protein
MMKKCKLSFNSLFFQRLKIMNFYLFSKLALKPFPVLLGCLILAEMIILDPTGRVAEPEPELEQVN